MTTRLRARAVRAGALLTLVTVSVFTVTVAVAPSPAQAAPVGVTIDSISSTDVEAGGQITLRYTVRNQSQTTAPISVKVIGMDCRGECSPSVNDLGIGGSRQFTATLTANDVDAGDSEVIQVQVVATSGPDRDQKEESVTVHGPDKPAAVRKVLGRVKSDKGKAVSGANVVLQDSTGREFTTNTNDDGEYAFTSSDQNPITPGPVTVGAAKDGFVTATVRVDANAGKTVTASLVLQAVAAEPTPTPTTAAPSPSETAATQEAAEEEAPTEPAPTADTKKLDNASQDTEGGGGKMLFILGGLLVAAGLGAIVLLIVRRKSNKGDDDEDGPAAGAGAGPLPSGPSRYGALDQTRVGTPMAAAGPLGRPDDATMITNRVGSPSLSDAPTMLQQAIPADDEFPDPYGAPALPHTGYHSGADAWSPPAGAAGAAAAAAATSVPYGGGTYGGGAAYGGAATPDETALHTPVSPAPGQYDEPYRAYSGGGDQQRYDEPTGMYRADQSPDRGDYDTWGAAAGGIDSGNAYGPPAGGTYGRGSAEPLPYGREDAAYGGQAAYDQDPSPRGYGRDASAGYGRDSETSVYGRGAEPSGPETSAYGRGAAVPSQGPDAGTYGRGAEQPYGRGAEQGYGGADRDGGYGGADRDGGYGRDGEQGYGSAPSAFRSDQGDQGSAYGRGTGAVPGPARGGAAAVVPGQSRGGSAPQYGDQPAGYGSDRTGGFRSEQAGPATGGYRSEPAGPATGSFRPEQGGPATGSFRPEQGGPAAGGYRPESGGFRQSPGEVGGYRDEPGSGGFRAQQPGYRGDQNGGYRGEGHGAPADGYRGADQGGYGADQGGYYDGGGAAGPDAGRRPPQPRPPAGEQNQRRSLDWLDD